MDQKKLDGFILDYIVNIFVQNSITWGQGITDQRKMLHFVTIGEMYERMLQYNGKHMDARENILKELTLAIVIYQNKDLSNEVKEMKDDIKNLNDKITVLIDALSIIDQKIEKLTSSNIH